MQEAIPTRPPKPIDEPWTPEEQAQHLADLLEAVADWHDPSPRAQAKRSPRHLRLIQTDQTSDAA